jgi:GTP-binding protein HflX
LFNALTKSRAFAADQLFATLDTTTRQLWLAEAGRSVVLSDTVGFIRDLPHKLVEAFRATLQEAADADLLLHVVDAASPMADEQMAEVDRVLEEIGAERIPQILVYNKLDLIAPEAKPRVAMDAIERTPGVATPRVFVSARDGQGLDVLRRCIGERVAAGLNGPALPTLEPLSSLDAAHGAA